MAYLRAEDENKVDEIIPIPHFVVKTKIFSPFGVYPSGTKLFINVCTNGKVPTKEVKGLPPNEFNLEKIFMMIYEGEWEIPILTSQYRNIQDKRQQKCILIDCVINDKYMRWCMANEELKNILIQWCFDAVEFNSEGIIIDRDALSILKRKSMGGQPESIFIDINEIEQKVKDLESVGKDIYEENCPVKEPSSFFKAKRLGDEIDEELMDLRPLLGSNEQTIRKKLIEEIEGDSKMSITSTASPHRRKENDKDSSPKVNINFEIEMVKLKPQETSKGYKVLIKICSMLSHAKEYHLALEKKAKELLISAEHAKLVKFPLPLDIIGEVECFFVKPEQKVYVYIA
ncbi:hypothetical protein CANINC_002797 [Pichia inconspicua]|uniref:PIH1 N-terminal domain-containing protein n=1 Tax=Pichia inconspicua TaxID=52247 RepID=A0A4T0X1W7_9ASCO|nr:hypothetical protein CANINC_002797 [[Candida] inconspicua]